MIKILIIDDSATDTALLKHIFEAEEDLEVIGCAQNGQEGIELAEKLKPDLITMDIQMPIMNGYEATRAIMMSNPIPIVVISPTVNNKQLNTAFQALEAGAVSVIEKPVNVSSPEFSYICERMVAIIRGMAEIKVIKQRFPKKIPSVPVAEQLAIRGRHETYEILAIGASVGGPQALKTLLSELPANFPLPIVIVQHMTAGFMTGFCTWLNEYCKLSVSCAGNLEVLKPGKIYFAPENIHLKIKRVNNQLVTHLQQSAPVCGFIPSINVLFESIAQACGKQAIGILFTGMGKDGAQGLLELKKVKAHTLIQDEKSCVVFGMASVALSLDAVDKIIELNQFVAYLCKLTQ
ncbi:MAG: chemotaxis-specific protein-glutamate methyltransferase CheB [Legionella sp.]|nr:chemotaxis-specific protein-glutamate methyltransferase CheB [Legionella sp.]